MNIRRFLEALRYAESLDNPNFIFLNQNYFFTLMIQYYSFPLQVANRTTQSSCRQAEQVKLL